MKHSLQRGFNLMEVLIAIAIFAIGMLALASLQGSLTRSGADANLRTVAANIAERTIEAMRGFGRLDIDPLDPTIPSYRGIRNSIDFPVCAADPCVDGDIQYTRTVEITDYSYDLATESYIAVSSEAEAISDFKVATVNVAWGEAGGFRQSETQDSLSSGELGSGEITLAVILSSSTTPGSARTITQGDGEDLTLNVAYHPGDKPDVIALSLGNNMFKEALTPVPKIFRDIQETRFEVITYSQLADSGAQFLRREEFNAIACECTLRPPSDTSPGRRPAIWAGDEYSEPEFVTKAFGEAAKVKQSAFCSLCCADHHDGGTGENDPAGDPGAILFNPFRDVGEYNAAGDHKHYKRTSDTPATGLLEVATNGENYLEACRMVRKDGFWRVAQDFRMEGLNVFPENFLIDSVQTAQYSKYVVDEVVNFVATPSGGLSPLVRVSTGICPDTDVDINDGYTCLPTSETFPDLPSDQQLRSRSIYVDYLSNDLKSVLSCVALAGTPELKLACESGSITLDKVGAAGYLDMLPFFEVQTTFLNEWSESPIDYIVGVSNQPVLSDNVHSRGRAELLLFDGSLNGDATAYARGHRGVLGITATDPIDNRYLAETMTGDIEVLVGPRDVTQVIPSGTTVSGRIVSYVPGIQAANLRLTPTGAVCNFTIPEFDCLVRGASVTAEFRLDLLQKTALNVVVCSNSANLPIIYTPTYSTEPVLDDFGVPVLDEFGNVITIEVVTGMIITVDLSAASGAGYVIWLDVDSCG